MFTSIISAVSTCLQIANTALNWFKQSSDQNTGMKLQQAAYSQSTITEAANAQKVDSAVAAVPDSDLDDQLRDSARS